jgi:hypothetical protein
MLIYSVTLFNRQREVLVVMIRLSVPDYVFDDICLFVSKNYSNNTSNSSLLITQAFILKYPDYGRKFGFSEINKAIEDGIKCGVFS